MRIRISIRIIIRKVRKNRQKTAHQYSGSQRKPNIIDKENYIKTNQKGGEREKKGDPDAPTDPEEPHR